MKKRVSFLSFIFVISILNFEIKVNYTLASKIETSDSYEKIYPEIGYMTVEEAVKEFEQHFNQVLKLPLRVPPISFTHQF
ncbi:hypothetical protein M3649_17215 [Ureibacillus chungkukjangi]|nr:hypothetical protein [Ureibacillus chungkukjangi]